MGKSKESIRKNNARRPKKTQDKPDLLGVDGRRGPANIHIRNEAIAERVGALVSYGIPREKIALMAGIHEETLIVHYKHELDTGNEAAVEKVAGKLFKRAWRDNDLAAQQFYLRTRGRWRVADKEEAPPSDETMKELALAVRGLIDKNKSDV